MIVRRRLFQIYVGPAWQRDFGETLIAFVWHPSERSEGEEQMGSWRVDLFFRLPRLRLSFRKGRI